VPFYKFEGHRTLLLNWHASVEKRDLEYAAAHPDACPADGAAPAALGPDAPPPYAEKGMKAMWREYSTSIDGLPSVTCFANPKPLVHVRPVKDAEAAMRATERELNAGTRSKGSKVEEAAVKGATRGRWEVTGAQGVLLGFAVGVVASGAAGPVLSRVAEAVPFLRG
jgi:hypothetical protein